MKKDKQKVNPGTLAGILLVAGLQKRYGKEFIMKNIFFPLFVWILIMGMFVSCCDGNEERVTVSIEVRNQSGSDITDVLLVYPFIEIPLIKNGETLFFKDISVSSLYAKGHIQYTKNEKIYTSLDSERDAPVDPITGYRHTQKHLVEGSYCIITVYPDDFTVEGNLGSVK